MEDIKEFERKKEILLRNRESALQRVEKAKEKYEKIKSDDTIDKKELRLEIAQKTIQSRIYALEQINNQLEFLRPSSQEDIDYRLKQYSEFSKQVKSEVPDDLHLCFHGCPIYAAKNIIEDGEISSSVDRIGSETSYDVSDQVSVTTKNTIETTVQGYTGLTGNYNLPAGCIFVILPKNDNEIQTSETSMLIGNVSFKENPERLYSIITTPENIEKVTEWAEKANIDLSKIHDFDGFIQEIGKQKKQEKFIDYDKILSDMPNDLTQIEMARYIYIQLGKYFSYDERYITSESDNEKREIFDRDIEDIENDKVVCTSLSRIYENLLNRAGITAKTVLIPGERLGHAFTELEIDGKKYFTGLIRDLMNIKTGFKTNEFMIDNPDRFGDDSEYVVLSEEKLKSIDDKIGYTYNRYVYGRLYKNAKRRDEFIR